MNSELLAQVATGFGMLLVLEGLMYAGFPASVKRIARLLPGMGDATLRNYGVIAMIIGIILIWLVKR